MTFQVGDLIVDEVINNNYCLLKGTPHPIIFINASHTHGDRDHIYVVVGMNNNHYNFHRKILSNHLDFCVLEQYNFWLTFPNCITKYIP